MSQLAEIKQYCMENHEELVEFILTLCRIPAPSHFEDARAAFVLEWLYKNGAEGAYVDDAKNVILPMFDSGTGPLKVYMAHTDTVFPDTTPFEPVVKDGRIHCPAVGDDTTNLAQMLFAIRYLIKTGKRPKGNVLFVANSCEEGLGNLKGSRKVMEDFGHRVAEFTTFDGSYTTYVDHSVGSRRYEVTITTEGGHSYGAFGNRNAIHYMASLIDTLYTLKVPKEGKSTYNVGIIEGGTSVNTIAQQCRMLFEYRSDRRENLASMDAFFHKTIEAYGAMGIGVTVELVGDRPCMGDVDPVMEQKLRDRVIKAIKDHTGNVVTGTSGSTDCNIPHSMGVPAICFGGYLGAGAHTREEYIEMESLKTGMPIILQYVLDDFN